MQGIQFKKRRMCLLAMLPVLVCIPLLSSFSSFGYISVMQDMPSFSAIQGFIPDCGANRDSWLPTLYQNPMADVFVRHTDFARDTQQLLSMRLLSSRKNNNCMTAFYGLTHNCCIHITPDFISLSTQCTKFSRHLIIPYNSHAPPDIFA